MTLDVKAILEHQASLKKGWEQQLRMLETGMLTTRLTGCWRVLVRRTPPSPSHCGLRTSVEERAGNALRMGIGFSASAVGFTGGSASLPPKFVPTPSTPPPQRALEIVPREVAEAAPKLRPVVLYLGVVAVCIAGLLVTWLSNALPPGQLAS
jgi:hypothetical protein